MGKLKNIFEIMYNNSNIREPVVGRFYLEPNSNIAIKIIRTYPSSDGLIPRCDAYIIGISDTYYTPIIQDIAIPMEFKDVTHIFTSKVGKILFEGQYGVKTSLE